MTVRAHRSYRFKTPAQWSACLFDGADQSPGVHDGVRPIAPYQHTAQLYQSPGARAPAASRAGDILWHDDVGKLHRLTACDDEPEVLHPAPYEIVHAARLLSMSSGLWMVSESKTSLQRYEEDTLTRLSTVDIPGDRVIDVAGDGYDLLFALVERSGVSQAVRIDCSGRIVDTLTFEGIANAVAFAFSRRLERFIVLAGDPYPHLHWFSAQGGAALLSIPIGAMHPCFTASAIGSDSRGRVFLAGADGATLGSKAFVLVFDGDGASLGEVALDARDSPANGLTGTRDSLLVTGPRGLLRYSVAQIVPDGAGEVRCSLITPMLQSPDREDQRRWLRIEATANLPDGATLEISYVATDDPTIRDRLTAIAADRTLLASHRVQKLLREPGIWRTPIAFHGSNVPPDETAAPLSAPLFDLREPYIWVCIALSATAGGALPSLSQLEVLYPGQTLMENLPAIYRREEAQPGSFLRSLVGVLETTTQGLDSGIAAMASHVHPSTATGPWLDFVARCLGVPWDDALDDEQKKRIVARASDLARDRGTRAGLEAFLDCLMPATPPRFRVTDATADFGIATIGGADCVGSALPTLLGGRTQWSTELDSNAVLGRMRLPCEGQIDDGARQIAGYIRVDVAASGDERRAWEPWLATLINEMVPLTARMRLRWVSAQALRGARLDGSLKLEAAPMPHLGGDAVIGFARLPERGSRITATGADIGTRLQ
ncbi:phage tail protein [Bradyrhizobium sp. S3.2.12]|uniref:phage tail protein n=1 Tax=Bradyrhizobium sp. S3.2.12 TaxID=3156387 RepID=UPI0033977EF6